MGLPNEPLPHIPVSRMYASAYALPVFRGWRPAELRSVDFARKWWFSAAPQSAQTVYGAAERNSIKVLEG
jgi:hypothetical protein